MSVWPQRGASSAKRLRDETRPAPPAPLCGQSTIPVFGFCGYSGSGKTTLIEALLPALIARGLRVAVLKHDCHGLDVDRKGKDSDRFFRAGADVLAQGPGESFMRVREPDGVRLEGELARLCERHDLVLVEGHKTSPIANKLWLLSEGETAPPSEAGQVARVLPRTADRARDALAWIDATLPRIWRRAPVYAGVLIGGRASRMGRPKHLIARRGGRTWLEQVVAAVSPGVDQVVLLGRASVPPALRDLPLLPDAPDAEGPLAGILAAMRWNPTASWLIAACDMPFATPSAVRWLLSTRRPGTWATLPRLTGSSGVEPLLAHYDFRARHLLEQCRGPSELARWKQCATPLIPPRLAPAWRNINTPAELAESPA